MATITITVTVSNPGSGNKYYLDGQLQYTYPAIPGNTYKFDQSDNSNDGHPLRLSITSDGTHNSGSAYTTGVTTSGTPGNAGAYTQIEVTALTVQALYYYCTAHSGMGGSFNVGSSETVQYQDRAGFSVQNRTENPIPFAQALANNPYSGAWSSGGYLNSSKNGMGAATKGANTSGLVFGGSTTTLVNETESYNGTAWTEVNNLNTARTNLRGGGTSTSAIAAGGSLPPASNSVEEWNGSNWTETTEVNTARYQMAGCGSNAEGIIIAGGYPMTAVVEQWNGSAWTEVGDLNQVKRLMNGFGETYTSGIIAGGLIPPGNTQTVNAESFNGSAWTETANLNQGRAQHSAFGDSVSDGYMVSGYDWTGGSSTANVENWNGSAWTEVANVATARWDTIGSGTSTAGMFMGGDTPGGKSNLTEEWGFAGVQPTDAASYSGAITGDIYYNTSDGQFKAIKNGGAPIGTWASGGNLPQNMILQGAFGGKDSVTTGGGSKSTGVVGDSFQYDGATWSEITELSTIRNQSAGLGTQNAGLVAGGYNNPPGVVVGNVEHWNGSSWTEVADVSPVRTGAGSAGVYTAGLVFGGNQPPLTASTMTWNASAWTEVSDLNAARNRFMGQAIGTQTAALAVEGEGVAGTESWNGSTWTEVADLNTPRHLGGGSGIQTAAVVSTGRGGPPGYTPTAVVEAWDGTSWTEINNVSSARAYTSSAGTAAGNPSSQSIIFGGATTSSTANTTATEEFSAEEFTINTLTTS